MSQGQIFYFTLVMRLARLIYFPRLQRLLCTVENPQTLCQKNTGAQSTLQRFGYHSNRRVGSCHVITLGVFAKGSDDFLQVPWENERVGQRRDQVTM